MRGDGPAPDQGRRGRIRADVLRPGLHQHRLLPLLGHLHRRRRRDPRTPRLLDRAALREVDLPRGRLPADLRRAADRAAARPLGLRHHPPHLRPRGPEAVLRGLPLRRPPDGDAARRRRRALDLLPGREADRRPRRALHGGGPPDRQGADPGRLLLPAQHGPPLRLPGQRAQLRRELPLDDVQENRRPAHPEAGALARRSTCSSSSTPTTNRTARPTPSAASAPPTSTPTRRSRPGSRRSTGRCTAAPTRRCCGCCGGSSRRRTSPTSSSG